MEGKLKYYETHRSIHLDKLQQYHLLRRNFLIHFFTMRFQEFPDPTMHFATMEFPDNASECNNGKEYYRRG